MKPSTTSQKVFIRLPERDISDEQAKGEIVLEMLLMIAKSHEMEGNVEVAGKFREFVRKKQRGKKS